MKTNKSCVFILLLLTSLITETIIAQEEDLNKDLQMWSAFRLTVPVTEKWSAALQNEVRFSDEISNLEEYIVKLYTS